MDRFNAVPPAGLDESSNRFATRCGVATGVEIGAMVDHDLCRGEVKVR